MRRNIVTAKLALNCTFCVFGLLFILCYAALPLKAADIQVNPPGPVFQLPVLAWGNTSATGLGFNNNFVFSPLSQNESVCVYVQNNNPTNNHGFLVQIFITPNPSDSTPSDNKWLLTAVNNTTAFNSGSTFPAPAGIGTQISGAANIAVEFSASGSAAGSPDTASVFFIQTQGTCFGGQNFTNSNTQTVFSVSPILAVADGLGQSYFASSSTTNPAANAALLFVNDNISSRKLYFNRAVVSTSAALATIVVNTAGTTGTGCSNSTPAGNTMSPGQGSSSVANAQTACVTTQPGALSNTPITYIVPSGTSLVIDLTGYVCSSNSTCGIDIISSTAITSVVTVGLYWYEK